MQGEKAQQPAQNLSDLLQQVAYNSDPVSSTHTVLRSIQVAIGAQASTLIYPSSRFLVLHSPDVGFQDENADTMREWASQLDVAWQAHHTPLPFDTPFPYCQTCGVGDGFRLILWFETPLDEPVTPPVDWQLQLPLLVITCQSLLSHIEHERTVALTRSLMDSILDPLLVLNEDMAVSMMNEAAENLFGITTDEAWHRPLHDVLQADDLIELIMNPTETERGRPVEWSTDSENGFTFLPRLSVVHTPAGEADGWILAMRDITRFKRFNHNQREFVRVVSHDLRSPLTSMQGFADMIRMGMVGEVTEKQVYFLEKILSGVSQMTSIVENIQDAGRFDPETGFYEMERTQIDLNQIVPRIVENHIVPPEKPNLSIHTRIEDGVPIVNADENMLNRAIANLVDNAIKYTPDGGTIEVSVTRVNDILMLSVADDGHGISEEDQQRLFQRHVRLDRRRHAKVKGTGLGLFIVRSVAQAHNGDATVASVIGEGTTFSIWIPLQGPNLIGYDTDPTA